MELNLIATGIELLGASVAKLTVDKHHCRYRK